MTSQQKRLKSPIRWLHTFVGTKKSLKIMSNGEKNSYGLMKSGQNSAEEVSRSTEKAEKTTEQRKI